MALYIDGKQVIEDLSNPIFYGQVRVANGTVAAPAIAFNSNLTTGIYRIGANNLGIATNGVLAWDVSATTITHALATTINSNALVGPIGSSLQTLSTIIPAVQQQGTALAASSFGLAIYSPDAVGPAFVFAKSRGAIDVLGSVLSGDVLGTIDFRGARGGASFYQGAMIQAVMDGASGFGSLPTYLAFYTTPSGSTTSTERARIDNAGIFYSGPFQIGGTLGTSVAGLQLTGSGTTITAGGSLTVTTNLTAPTIIGATTASGAWTMSGGVTVQTLGLTITDVNVALSATTGTQFGTAITQKLGFYGATAIVQRAGAAQAAVATTASTQTTPYGYTTAAQADGIVTLVNELRAALVALGLVKGAA